MTEQEMGRWLRVLGYLTPEETERFFDPACTDEETNILWDTAVYRWATAQVVRLNDPDWIAAQTEAFLQANPEERDRIDCPDCGGWGEVPTDHGSDNCPGDDCTGSLDCPTCTGRGSVPSTTKEN